MFKFIAGGSIALYGYNRLGYAGENEVRFCPHEKYHVKTGFLYDTYVYQPNDCYIKVRGKSIRPLKITVTDDECWSFGDECAGIENEELDRKKSQKEFEKSLDEADKNNSGSEVKLVLGPKGIQPGIELGKHN